MSNGKWTPTKILAIPAINERIEKIIPIFLVSLNNKNMNEIDNKNVVWSEGNEVEGKWLTKVVPKFLTKGLGL